MLYGKNGWGGGSMAKRSRAPKCKLVGVIIKNGGSGYLTAYRTRNPKGLSFPTGHIEEGESPEEALFRVLKDLVGITPKKFKIRASGIHVLSKCRKGAKKHAFYVYEVTDYTGRRKKSRQARYSFMKFMLPKKIRAYIECDDIDQAWVEILKRLNLCKKQASTRR